MIIVNGNDANSYLSSGDVETRMSFEYFHYDAYSELENDEKEKLIITSAKIIDESFEFIGEKTDSEQNMKFPRDFSDYENYDFYSKDDSFYKNRTDIIPDEVKSAQIEQIKYILDLKGDREDFVNQELGLKSEKIDFIGRDFTPNRKFMNIGKSASVMLLPFTVSGFSIKAN